VIESEVIVVGGGPAGSTCAWKLKQNNIETIVLDKKTFPRHKVCAGWITPKALKDLCLKIENYPHSIMTFKKLHFSFRGKKLTPRTCQYSIRRYEFDHWLLERTHAPVYQHTVNEIRRENGYYIIDDLFRCKYLVGAGGTDCPVYRTFFKEINPRVQEQQITAMEEEFLYDYQDKNCYLWFFENNLPGYSWYIPKGDGHLNVGIGGKLAVLRNRGETIRNQWDQFVKKLETLSLVKHHSFNPRGYNYFLRQNVDVSEWDHALITGDAVGLATLDMGEGIGPAVESGILAAKAIINGSRYSLKSVTKHSFIRILIPWLK
jgi:flavin-dependent dehydrogenase